MASSAGKPRHIPIREDWLALRSEEVIDAGRPIIDAHHHLWDKPGSRYLVEDMAADIADGHRIVATVFVEGKQLYRTEGDLRLASVGETEAIAAMAEQSLAATGGACRVAAGIVGFADLALGEAVGEVLDAHVEAGRGRFRGVRGTSAWHADPEARGSIVLPPPGLLYEPSFRRGLRELARRGLVFDAWMYHTQLLELVDLAHAMPDLRIVLNHQGGPLGIGPYSGRRDEVFGDWRHFIRRLGAFPNVSVKLGGFGMLMSGFDFDEQNLPPSSEQLAAAWAPYHLECIEAFGAHRCMFESNFPVDKGSMSYRTMWNAFKRIAAHCSEDEKDRLFLGSADSIYQLGVRSAIGAEDTSRSAVA